MALPELYMVAKQNHWFGLRRFGYFMLQGIYQVSPIDQITREAIWLKPCSALPL